MNAGRVHCSVSSFIHSMHSRIRMRNVLSPTVKQIARMNGWSERQWKNLVMVCAGVQMIVLHSSDWKQYVCSGTDVCALCTSCQVAEFSFDLNFAQKLDYMRWQVINISSKFSSSHRKRYIITFHSIECKSGAADIQWVAPRPSGWINLCKSRILLRIGADLTPS